MELTETSLFEDPEATKEILERFSSLGVKISVDDFGTGYSSLSHLHRFPLDEIKIDRLFIENLDDQPSRTRSSSARSSRSRRAWA